MKVAEVRVDGCRCETTQLNPIPKGVIGAAVSIEYTDPVWDSLRKTVVFRSTVTRDVLSSENEVIIPAEVVSRAGACLYMGVYGVDDENRVAIPTIWAELGVIQGAATPSGDASTSPALPVWAQIQSMVGDLGALDTEAKSDLVAAINEALTKGGGEIAPTDVQKIVEDYLKANPPSGGTDISLGLTSATVGQLVKVKAVDADGTPTAWEAADLPAGAGETWESITEITLDDAVNVVTINKDANGNSFALKRVMIDCVIKLNTDDPFTTIKTQLNGLTCANNATPTMNTLNPRYYSFYAEIIPGSGALCWQACSGSNYNWVGDLLKMGYKYNNLWQSDAITSLTIQANDGNKNIGLAGTKINVLGVRA